MAQSDMQFLTQSLARMREGDLAARQRFLPVVYEELRALARETLHRPSPNNALQPGALVQEAYARLLGANRLETRDRLLFMAVAAGVMRQLLVDHARKDHAGNDAPSVRDVGTAWRRITLSTITAKQVRGVDLLELERALIELESLDAAQARIVVLRYFGGLTIDEAANETGLSATAVEREWRSARAWLGARLLTTGGAA